MPQRISDAIQHSPTAGGCTARFSQFTVGGGFAGPLGGQVVNRHGETLNDILDYSVNEGYSKYYFFALHFNFNLLGEIIEIFALDPCYLRKLKDGTGVVLKDWGGFGGGVIWGGSDSIKIDRFGGPSTPTSGMRRDGRKQYKGQVFCFQANSNRAYPYAPLQSALQSVSYEDASQTSILAGSMNGFRPQCLIKYPVAGEMNEHSKVAFDNFNKQLGDFSGPENSGRIITTMFDTTMGDEVKPFNMIERIGADKDGAIEAYTKMARENILSAMFMPPVLLCNNQGGLFSKAAYAEAYNVKITDSVYDQARLSRAFTEIISKSVWKDYGDALLLPAKML